MRDGLPLAKVKKQMKFGLQLPQLVTSGLGFSGERRVNADKTLAQLWELCLRCTAEELRLTIHDVVELDQELTHAEDLPPFGYTSSEFLCEVQGVGGKMTSGDP